MPHTISLSEFRPSTGSHLQDHARVARYWGYHLLSSSPDTKAGVALLVHTSISPNKPSLRIHIPGRLISCRLSLHMDPLLPRVTVASFYSPHTSRERLPCEKHLDPLTRECAILLGDYNGVTSASHTTTLPANIWPWPVAKERSGALADLLTPHFQDTPYTRVRRYHGTKSYIDRASGSRTFAALFKSTDAAVPDFSKVTGIQDHDPILVHTVPWGIPHMPESSCAMWNRRDVLRYQQRISQLMRDLPIPHAIDEVEATYSTVTAHMLYAMRETNEKKQPMERRPTDVTDWAKLVRQLARQAKRAPKFFSVASNTHYSHPPRSQPSRPPHAKYNASSKETRPGPPVPSIWYQHNQLPLTPPPTVQELSSLARAPKKKSPGPDSVPPYLIASLPDPVFAVIHKCIVLCYEPSHIPRQWLISETFCLFKGKGQWQDPDE